MAVVRTDVWLDENFSKPAIICQRFLKEFNETESEKIYQYLVLFGMYTPNRASLTIFQKLKEIKAWEALNNIYEKYKNRWGGPEVNVYLFPISTATGLFMREKRNKKSGVSFPDRMFLFIGDYDDELELEAIFVHEYHHICRMKKQKKHPSNFTLLDSIILEGLAEWEVKNSCGTKYLAEWCHYYSDSDIESFWEKYLKHNLNVKKEEALHDQLLYGYSSFPKLLGYACGYYLVRRFNKEKSFSTKINFSLTSEVFINDKKEIKETEGL